MNKNPEETPNPLNPHPDSMGIGDTEAPVDPMVEALAGPGEVVAPASFAETPTTSAMPEMATAKALVASAMPEMAKAPARPVSRPVRPVRDPMMRPVGHMTQVDGGRSYTEREQPMEDAMARTAEPLETPRIETMEEVEISEMVPMDDRGDDLVPKGSVVEPTGRKKSKRGMVIGAVICY